MSLKDFRGFLKSLKRKNALILLVLAVAFVYILFNPRGLIQRLSLEIEKSSLEKKIQSLEMENASMEKEIIKLQIDDKEIERIAREKYFMHKNGEKVVKVQPK